MRTLKMKTILSALALVGVIGILSPGFASLIPEGNSVSMALPSLAEPSTVAPAEGNDDDSSREAAMEALKPLQVILGKWRGTTRREYERFKAVDHHEWVWDLKSDPDQPALVMESDKSPYFRSASLTWDAKDKQFRLTGITPEKETQVYTGDFTEPVREVEGDDNKLQRVFVLTLTETEESAKDRKERWQIQIAQQNNNRYLLQVDRRRGRAAFRRYDTVSTQREGTSFAISDSDYGEKECLISQGLGTIAVSYKGRTYWVCCSGCKAAFEEEPETWIARAAARKKKQ